MRRWRRKTNPAVEPVSLNEAKDHLRVDEATEDDLISRLISVSREHLEDYCNRGLITQTWELTQDGFDDDGLILLPRPPVQSVTEIQYVDTDQVTQTLAADQYVLDSISEPGVIRAAHNVEWPSISDDSGSVKITYVVGYGDAASDVPTPLKQAMLLLIGHWYEHRETVSEGVWMRQVPMAAISLMWPYRVLEM